MTDLPNLFTTHLKIQGYKPVSIRSYRSDLNHFLGWLTLSVRGRNLSFSKDQFELIKYYFRESYVVAYKQYLIDNNLPSSTVNRRLSTLRTLADFCLKQGLISVDPTQTLSNVATQQSSNIAIPSPQQSDILDKFYAYLNTQNSSANTIKNYLSDIREYVIYAKGQLNEKNMVKDFLQYLAVKGTSKASLKRLESSLRKFYSWAVEGGYLRVKGEGRNFFGLFHTPPFALRPFSLRSYRALPYFTYLNFLILIIFLAALGFGVYRQFIVQAPQKLAFPNAPVTPNRFLSFQGLLTNADETPITTATNVTFKLYDAAGTGTPPTGGNLLWNSGTCSIDPDTDGIFDTILGSTCGGAIPSSVFTENSQVWLEITVISDTLSPRIQIATVAYALNSETLQGFPIASTTNATAEATMGATARTIPAINPAGNLVLASASPTLWSTSGTFAIKGQALSIVSEANGNITLAPNGSGLLNLTLSANTGNVINATDANLGTSGGKEANTLYYGEVANNNTNVNLLKLASGSSPTPKFTVDYVGNASMAGALNVLSTITANTTGTINGLNINSGAVSGITTLSMNNQLTNSYANSAAINLTGNGSGITFTGAGPNQIITAASQNLALMPGGNVGIGTTNPNYKLDVTGYANASSGLCINGDCKTAWSSIAGTNYWTLNQGALYPNYATADLFIGGTATSSANFAFINNLTGTPTASFSGNLTLTGSVPVISTTNMRALTIGGTATGNIQLAAGSATPAFVLTTAGQVGIGTTNPGYKLHVYDNSNAVTSLADIDQAGTGDAALQFRITGVTGWRMGVDNSDSDKFKISNSSSADDFGTDYLTIQNGGNVGIGTTAPATKLNVVGDYVDIRNAAGAMGTGYGMEFGTNSNLPRIDFVVNGTYVGQFSSSASNIIFKNNYYNSSAGIDFQTKYDANNTTSRMYITSGGNVGIGTTNPTSMFSVGSTSQFQVNSSGAIAAAAGVVSTGNIDFSSLSAGGLVKATVTSGRLAIATGGSDYEYPLTFTNGLTRTSNDVHLGGQLSELTKIDLNSNNFAFWNTGSVGIGNTSPLATLDITGTASVSSNLYVGSSLRPSNSPLSFDYKSGVNTWATAMTIANTGNIGIGTTNPAQKLDVSGNATVSGYLGFGNNAPAFTTCSSAADEGKQYYNGVNNTMYYCNGTTWISMGTSSSLTGSGTASYIPKWNTSSDLTNSILYDTGTNIGIGTTAPLAKLDIAGDASLSGNLYMGSSIRPSNSPLSFDYKSGANTWATAMTIANSGNIGIGTTAPNVKLKIAAAGTFFGVTPQLMIGDGVEGGAGKELWVGYDTTGDYSYIQSVHQSSAFTNLILQPASGNVGIGTTTPNGVLDVMQGTTASRFSKSSLQYLEILTGLTTNSIKSYSQSSSEVPLIIGNVPNAAAAYLSLRTADTDRIRITYDGNIGIGTTAPSQKLDVAGNATISGTLALGPNTLAYAGTCDANAKGKQYFNGVTNIMYYCNGTSWITMGSSSSITGSGTANYIPKWNTSSDLTNSILYDTGTNIGIGTTAPLAKLDIAGDASASGDLYLRGTSTTHGINIYDGGNLNITTSVGGGSGTSALYIANSGKIGIGTTAPGTSAGLTSSHLEIADVDGNNSDMAFRVASGGWGTIFMAASQGTLASPTNSVNGNTLGSFQFKGYASGYQDVTNIEGFVDGVVGTYVPGGIRFKTQNDAGAYNEAMRITSTGNVGIGTTAPSSQLHIAATGTTTATMALDQQGSGGAAASFYQFGAPTGTGQSYLAYRAGSKYNIGTASTVGGAISPVVTIDSSGNVGIGTTSPLSQLHITGNLTIEAGSPAGKGIIVKRVADNITRQLLVAKDNGGTSWYADFGEATGLLTAYRWWGNNGEIMRLTNAGSLGIGTTSPTALLDVAGTASVSALTIRGGSPGYVNQLNGNDLIFRTSVSGDTGLTDRMTLTNGGNVGIGTTSPNAKLQVALNGTLANFGDGTNTGGIWILNGGLLAQASQFQITSASTNPISFYTGATYNSFTAGTEKMRLSSAGGLSLGNSYAATDPGAGSMIISGNVGIGTSAPGYKLDIAGNMALQADEPDITINDTGTAGYSTLTFQEAGTNKFAMGKTNTGNFYISPYYGAAWHNEAFVMNTTNSYVGIGTTAPGYLLEVGNSMAAASYYDTANSAYYLDPAAASSLNMAGYATAGASLAVGYSGVKPGFGNAAFSGSVGIGTTAPGVSLDIGGTSPHIRLLGTATQTRLSFDTSQAGSKQWHIANEGNVNRLRFMYADDANDTNPVYAGVWYPTGLALGGNGASGANVSPALWVGQTTGNVGIGTTSPGEKLEVSGNIKLTSQGNYLLTGIYSSKVWTPGQLVGSMTYMGQYGPAMTYLADYNAGWKGNNTGTAAFLGIVEGQLSFATAPSSGAGAALTWTDKFVINSSGNVGIGTTSPGAKLHSLATTEQLRLGYDASNYQSFTANSSGNLTITKTSPGGCSPLLGCPSVTFSNAVLFSSDLGVSGNVGIGTTNPTNKLVVGPDIGASGTPDSTISIGSATDAILQLGTSSSAKGYLKWFNTGTYLSIGTASNQNIAMNPGTGNVGIGTTSPGAKLDVAGSVKATLTNVLNTNYVCYNAGTREITQVNGACGPSDRRLKRDLIPLTDQLDILGSLDKLQGKYFYWDTSNPLLAGADPNRQIGLIAQDVEQVMPELVNYNSSGYRSLDYPKLTAYLIEATKAVMNKEDAQFANLSARLQSLEATAFGGQAGLTLNNSGNLNIIGPDGQAVSASVPQSFSLSDSAGQIIKRVGAFSEAAIANLRAGLIQSTQIITDTLSSTQINTDKLLSPIVETSELRITNDELRITNKDGKVLTETKNNGQTTHFGDLLVQGRATVSGELTVSNLRDLGDLKVSGNATIAGTLYADEIVTKHGKFGDLLANQIAASTISAQYITNIQQTTYNIVQSTPSASGSGGQAVSASVPQSVGTSGGQTASGSSGLSGISDTLNSPISSDSALLLSQASSWVTNDPNSNIKINSDIQILGRTSLADTSIAGQLMVDASILINSSGISSLPASTLYLQPSGWGSIDLMAGKVLVDLEGNVQVLGKIMASEFAPLPNSDLTFNLERPLPATDTAHLYQPSSSFGKLLVKGLNNETVALIDSEGNAAFKKLTIAADFTATQSAVIAQINTNATSGIGLLPAGYTEFTIYNPKITNDTLIYVTPEGSTQNKVLYVSAKQAEDTPINQKGFFKVAIDTSINTEIKFNWWIIN